MTENRSMFLIALLSRCRWCPQTIPCRIGKGQAHSLQMLRLPPTPASSLGRSTRRYPTYRRAVHKSHHCAAVLCIVVIFLVYCIKHVSREVECF